jgi:4-hydroxy-tetrahydrodipicolinate synthase
MKTKIISAICTAIKEDQTLDSEAMDYHIQNQFDNGISGVLIGGSMGYMQLLSDETYIELIEYATEFSSGRGEVMIGVGDTSLIRTKNRIEAVESFKYDSVVVLTPYFLSFKQNRLIDYFNEIAQFCKRPVILYDLPAISGVPLAMDTIIELSKTPNIVGIKSSRDWKDTSQLIDLIESDFRVIPAQPFMVDKLIRLGINSNLDGIYSVLPELTTNIVRTAENKDWSGASKLQNLLSGLLRLLRTGKYDIYPACSAIMNEKGISGEFFPAPFKSLNQNDKTQFFQEDVVKKVLEYK